MDEEDDEVASFAIGNLKKLTALMHGVQGGLFI